MSVLSAIQGFFRLGGATANGSAYPYRQQLAARTTPVELPPAALYRLLKSAYLTNGFYDELRAGGFSVSTVTPGMKSVRNPISAVVDVLGSKLYPDPLIVTTPLTDGVTSQAEREKIEARDPVKAAIEQVYQWSNWPRRRREHARWTALYGESWLKVVASAERGRVYFELIEPEYVTDYTLDERDFVTMARLDIPQAEDTATGIRRSTHTEVWSRDLGTLRVWRTEGDASARRIEDLGAPDEETPLSAFGIDFCPLVRTPFKEMGGGRAIGAVQLALEAVIEADLSATNLHSMVYTDAEGAWVATAAGVDANGRPIPALRLASAEPTFDALGRQTGDGTGQQGDGSVTVGKRSFWRLPAGYDLKSVVPDINYLGALAILQDGDAHLERLMPAMAYLRISEMSGGDLSGRAITYKMRAFEDQVREGRSNVLASLEQADMMALTMGQAIGLFPDLGGTYESGAFAHGFMDQPILPVSSIDEAEEARTRSQAAQALASAGVPMTYILTDVLDVPEKRAEELVAMAAEDAEKALEMAAALEPARPDRADGENADAAAQ